MVVVAADGPLNASSSYTTNATATISFAYGCEYTYINWDTTGRDKIISPWQFYTFQQSPNPMIPSFSCTGLSLPYSTPTQN